MRRWSQRQQSARRYAASARPSPGGGPSEEWGGVEGPPEGPGAADGSSEESGAFDGASEASASDDAAGSSGAAGRTGSSGVGGRSISTSRARLTDHPTPNTCGVNSRGSSGFQNARRIFSTVGGRRS